MGWKDWNIYLHKEEDQTKRIDASYDVLFENVDTVAGTGVTSKGYNVSLDQCTCPDFVHRKLPCKHIYALAKILKKFVAPQKIDRTRDLIVELDEYGFSKDWMFVVRECNYPSLDIKWSDFNKYYTQGKDYHFTTGAIYYDTPAAYADKPWGEVKQEIEFSLQVIDSLPNIRYYDFEKKDGILYARPGFLYGTTKFEVYRFNHHMNTEEKYKQFSCTNNEFVNLLKYGRCANQNGDPIDIQDWYN